MGKKKPELKLKYKFFFNQDKDAAFTRCPKCNNMTKVRKLPFVIHLEKVRNFISVNMECKFCPYCDLLIARAQEVENIVCSVLGKEEVDKSDYEVIGTLERKIWKKSMTIPLYPHELLDLMYFFKDVWEFSPPGWYKQE
ncbi:MAG: hypothetical protein DRN71_01590 [Candidatus Nanohalarchaeota archaeon]|nr:MAG: hypothetical protein DRN71_01590 [Candidatus Nanohaloarchaeota archaeon]